MKWILALGLMITANMMAPRGYVPCDSISDEGICSAPDPDSD